jgi:dolichol-phosphate mannosyltransferase
MQEKTLAKVQPRAEKGNHHMALRNIVIIPCCKNTKQLLQVIPKFRKINVNEICLVVDGAGEEEISQICKASETIDVPVHLIRHVKRKGVVFAIRQGINYALSKNFDVATVMAGNGKDCPDEIIRLVSPLLTQCYDYVQGSRFLPGGRHVKNPFFRRMFSRLYPFVWTLFTQTRCTDVTNGFRAYRLALFKDPRININQSWLDGYQLEYYIHYKALTLGYKTREVPVSKVYQFSHKGGYSNISPLRDWWSIISPLLYLKFGVKK